MDAEYFAPKDKEVTASLAFSAINNGTEKANLIGARNSQVHTPDEAPKIYNRLASDPNFPIGVLFDWTDLD